jgi:hypothetical protein
MALPFDCGISLRGFYSQAHLGLHRQPGTRAVNRFSVRLCGAGICHGAVKLLENTDL